MKVKRVSAKEAHELTKAGYMYLDVRSTQEFERGHPAGAFNVPLMHQTSSGMTANPDFLDVVRATFPKDAQMVVGCKAGGRSLRAAEALMGAGYTNVIDQRAGFSGAIDPATRAAEPGWEPQGLPVSRTAEGGRSYAELAKVAKKSAASL